MNRDLLMRPESWTHFSAKVGMRQENLCKDAFSIVRRDEEGRSVLYAAVADGLTESRSTSGYLAQVLVEWMSSSWEEGAPLFDAGKIELHWPALSGRWKALASQIHSTLFSKVDAFEAAGSTLFAIRLQELEQRLVFHGIAVGDSAAFVIFPDEGWKGFNNGGELSQTQLSDRDHATNAISVGFSSIQLSSPALCIHEVFPAGSQVLLMTDALAEWTHRKLVTEGVSGIRPLLELKLESEFVAWIRQRQYCEDADMEKDDVALIRVPGTIPVANSESILDPSLQKSGTVSPKTVKTGPSDTLASLPNLADPSRKAQVRKKLAAAAACIFVCGIAATLYFYHRKSDRLAEEVGSLTKHVAMLDQSQAKLQERNKSIQSELGRVTEVASQWHRRAVLLETDLVAATNRIAVLDGAKKKLADELDQLQLATVQLQSSLNRTLNEKQELSLRETDYNSQLHAIRLELSNKDTELSMHKTNAVAEKLEIQRLLDALNVATNRSPMNITNRDDAKKRDGGRPR